ncbi:MAG: hypothetical protein ETSY1_08365 [Candidatus Entotheonella factor]|uniref:Methyltransferase domain-containing protein n=1 Tax=Entotheonella factor TaxID=1429438 RepID=W4LTZ1_ENTF1|nr:MAG: hypothetical protein ETSY1_08365 [Candidatus Entotheonella factor]
MATSESYTPGHSQNATDFMLKRSVQTHGQFFLPYLSPGVSVLDCGCGPGSMSLSIASLVAPGNVVGVDFGASQIESAMSAAIQAGVQNAAFRTADVYALPFENATFDRVFSHALLEHLSDPQRAVGEMFRVLKPGGYIGVCSPDWGGFVLSPPSAALTQAIDAYTTLQTRNGGDVYAGRKLGVHLQTAGFDDVQMAARYECYPSLAFIGEYLALQLEGAGEVTSATTLREWSHAEGGMFAQCWVSCTARKG